MTLQIQTLASDNNLCGEGPLWDHLHQRLIWNDISSSLLYAFDPATSTRTTIHRGLMISAETLNRDNTLVVAGATGLHLLRPGGEAQTILTTHDNETLFFNDMLADPAGRVYVGTTYWGANGMEKTGKLYLVSPNGQAQIVDDGITMSNGLGLSPDNRTLYFSDTSARVIYAYDVNPATGTLSNRRVFTKVPSSEGIPDGLTVDAQGFVWCANWYGAQVVRYDPTGKAERRIKFPVTQTSSVAFGGKNLDQLYVTSAADLWPSEYTPPGFDPKAPTGGQLFRVQLDIQGKLEHTANFPTSR